MTQKISNLIEDDLQKVEHLLHEIVESEIKEIPLIYSYTLKAGGKRFRPALVLLSSKLFSGDNDNKIIKLSTASEVVHMASLIHDDVIDDNNLRRGILTPNYKWGNKMAVFVADYILLNTLLFLLKEFNSNVIDPLFRAISKMCEGELLQIKTGGDLNIRETDYIEIIDKKTASLISACCEIGARAANADEDSITAMARYGKYIGLAFQIVDDLMDLIFTSKQIGKTPGNDLRDGKITLPVIRSFYKACERDKSRLIKLIRLYPEKETVMDEILHLINKYDGIEYSRKKAFNYLSMALNQLEHIKDCDARNTLIELGKYVISRVN